MYIVKARGGYEKDGIFFSEGSKMFRAFQEWVSADNIPQQEVITEEVRFSTLLIIEALEKRGLWLPIRAMLKTAEYEIAFEKFLAATEIKADHELFNLVLSELLSNGYLTEESKSEVLSESRIQ